VRQAKEYMLPRIPVQQADGEKDGDGSLLSGARSWHSFRIGRKRGRSSFLKGELRQASFGRSIGNIGRVVRIPAHCAQSASNFYAWRGSLSIPPNRNTPSIACGNWKRRCRGSTSEASSPLTTLPGAAAPGWEKARGPFPGYWPTAGECFMPVIKSFWRGVSHEATRADGRRNEYRGALKWKS
jgi:hypothetical protein